jgi:(R,R)-butanediol dehydrogenase/meso-butanediol dehydrogenase/diacetyl reductase
MRAAVYHGAHAVRIEEVPLPERASGEALIKVLRSGMCGTDATEYKAGPIIFPLNRVHPHSGHTGPMIMGHEFVGEVLEADADAKFSVGDLVASGAGVSCGTCARCLEGRTNLCVNYYTLGLNAQGGLAEFVSAPESTLVALPAGLDIDLAGLAQPLAVGLHAARRSGAKDGDTVLLIGAGAIGTFVLAGLTHLVDARVIVTDFAGPRLDRAARLGAAAIVPVGDTADAAILLAIGANGADVVIEASGAPGQLNRAISLVRPGGTVLQVGLPSAEQAINVHSLVMREVSIQTTLAHVCGEDLAPALEILATTGLGAELLDSVNPLESLPGLLAELATGKIEGKVLFDPAMLVA